MSETYTLMHVPVRLVETIQGIASGALVAVPRKLLTETHACMRACGWQLAPDDDDLSDGVLALAVADIERRVAAMLAAAQEAGHE